MPNATRLPRTRKGGESEAFMLKKPIIVVAVVKNTGQALPRIDSAIAASLSSPPLMPEMIDSTTWTECAMASVMMMRGTLELAALSTRPIQPMTPMAEMTVKMTTAMRDSVPNRERSRMAATNTMTRNAAGRENPHIVLGRFRQNLVHEDVAGYVIFDIRIFRPGLGQEAADMVVNPDLRGVGTLGQGENNDQAGNAPVCRDETAYDTALAQRNLPDPREILIAERARVVHEALHDQVVPFRLGVVIVDEGVDPCGPGHAP